MILLTVLVFIATFALAAVVLAGMGVASSKLLRRRLQALDCDSATPLPEEAVDIRREEKASNIAWLNRWMTRNRIAPRARLLLDQANVKVSVERLVALAGAGWLVAFLGVRAAGAAIFSALFLSSLFLPLPLIYVFKRRATRLAKLEQQLPEALDMVVAALQVGHSLITAVGALAQDFPEPLAGEFRKLFDEQNFGLDPQTAMMNLALRVPLPDVRIFVAAALIQRESGGNLAEVLSKVAQTTRARFQLRKQISVHTAQGRLTGWILSLMPVVLGFAMYLVNPDGISVLWRRPEGVRLLAAAVVMIALGWVSIQKIVRIRV